MVPFESLGALFHLPSITQ